MVLCLIVIAHKPQECYVDWGHPEVECFKMQTKILTKAAKNLKIGVKKLASKSFKCPQHRFLQRNQTTKVRSSNKLECHVGF
jgi:hypothetical protein